MLISMFVAFTRGPSSMIQAPWFKELKVKKGDEEKVAKKIYNEFLSYLEQGFDPMSAVSIVATNFNKSP